MSDNIIFEHLRHICGQLDYLQTDSLELNERAGAFDVQYASLSRRVARMGDDLSLIRRRLDLVEA
jgi:hypothetical protein